MLEKAAPPGHPFYGNQHAAGTPAGDRWHAAAAEHDVSMREAQMASRWSEAAAHRAAAATATRTARAHEASARHAQAGRTSAAELMASRAASHAQSYADHVRTSGIPHLYK